MKGTYDGSVYHVDLDPNDPKERFQVLKKQHEGKNPKALTDKEKVALFDAYVDAGIITL